MMLTDTVQICVGKNGNKYMTMETLDISTKNPSDIHLVPEQCR